MTDQSTITKGSDPLAYQSMNVEVVKYMKAIHVLACLASMPDDEPEVANLMGSTCRTAEDLGYDARVADLAFAAYCRAEDIVGSPNFLGNDYAVWRHEVYAEAECLLREGFEPGEQIFP